MATVVLQSIGTAVGGAFGGPIGAMVGRAAGALAGNAIDQKLFTKDQVIEGPRLDGSRVLTSNEGFPIPKVYGRNRISGQIIWATRFEETSSQSGGGGKGGASSPRTKSFSYFANFAVGISEGPVSVLRRVWADGKEIDLTKIEYRFYKGDELQQPDPLIEAKQGLGNTPAYRGLSYIVFEMFPLASYGNRIPQLTFEIVRSVGKLETQIRSMTVIPGSTEYGYSPSFISDGGGASQFRAFNRNNPIAVTDWKASIDELQALCPNLESVSLVVAWFGNDLRAGNCQIAPGVTSSVGAPWEVANLFRRQAHLISEIGGSGAYGGTPSDNTVRNAIRDLKARGLRVVLYPFIMMDVPQSNALPNPYGGSSQPSYPWRGEITCFPAPGIAATVDKTAGSRAQINSFAAQYRNMFLHYARLCASVGGIDGFLVGSEMRGITRVRDGNGQFPFVEALTALASDARQILGADCKITYAADWSEYFGYQPTDGSGDVLFNLDPLWASNDIDAIGIDNYMPLADWRDHGDPADSQGGDEFHSIYSLDYLKKNIAREEGYDWFYETQAKRQAGIRQPITDGQGEPWVYRYKDLYSWWSTPHHNRINGVRSATSTVWQPQSKPFFFTELGCPAIDKGANQPNVFFDEKSAQSSLPYFSAGGRDDLIQRRFLQAHYEFWADPVNNPVSSVYGEAMVDDREIAPWSWDARPFPWFPLDTELWSDGDNWHRGHWLNGRLGAAPLDDLIREILQDYGYENVEIQCDGYLDGYIVPNQSSARAALEPLLNLFDVFATEEGGKVVLRQSGYSDRHLLVDDQLIQEGDDPKIVRKRNAELELPAEAIISHTSVFNNFQPTASKSHRINGGSDRQISINLPAVLSEAIAVQLAEKRLRESWQRRDEMQVSLPAQSLKIVAGDIVSFVDAPTRKWLVESVESGARLDISLVSIEIYKTAFSERHREKTLLSRPLIYGKPEAHLINLPLMRSSDQNKHISYIASSAQPWAGSYAVYSSPSDNGFALRATLSNRSIIGSLLSEVTPNAVGVWDNRTKIQVALSSGQFQSASREAVLNGGNTALLETQNGEYEIIQFANAQLQEDGTWVLSQLLRAQFGTEHEMQAGSLAGSKCILLDEGVSAIELEAYEKGLLQNWRVGPATDAVSADTFAQISHTNESRHQRMFSPAHLRTRANSQGLSINWIRRGRIDSDSWDDVEIPLDAINEQYWVRILDETGSLLRESQTSAPELLYSNSEMSQDFGSGTNLIKIEVAQIGVNNAPGSFASATHLFA